MNTLSQRFLSFSRAHAKLITCALFGSVIGFALPSFLAHHAMSRFIIGWNAGTILYLVLIGIMMSGMPIHGIRSRAQAQDEGEFALLVGVIFSAIVCLLAIVAELVAAKTLFGWRREAHIALAVLTIVTSWAFTHIMFALHYAHEFYGNRADTQNAGLRFPGTSEPTYGDFVYFAFVVGTSGQTADVSITTSKMRRIGSVHCVVAFVFNTAVLALTINIAASLLAG